MKLKVLLLIAQGFLRKKSVTNAKRILPDTTRNGKGFKHAAAYGILRNETKRNETKRNGILRNGTLRNGILRNGILRNGILRNGILRNGTLRNGTLRNGLLLPSL